MRSAAQAQAGRERARQARLAAARERRLELDPEEVARHRRIDDAVVDVEEAWERRAAGEAAVAAAEAESAAAVARLVGERLAVKDIARLIGLDVATVRRLSRLGDVETGTGADHA